MTPSSAAPPRWRRGRTQAGWCCTGPYSRRFYAFPLFAAPAGTIVTAATAGDLVAEMHAAEAVQPGHPPPAGNP